MSTEYEYVVRDDRTSSKSNCPDTNNGTVGGSKLAWGGGTLYPPKNFYCLGKFSMAVLIQKLWLKLAKGKTLFLLCKH
jgi:hypothetical protein